MTAQDKAIELVTQFTLLPTDYSVIHLDTAKLCALKVVYEVLDTCSIEATYSFYLEVKNQIEKL